MPRIVRKRVISLHGMMYVSAGNLTVGIHDQKFSNPVYVNVYCQKRDVDLSFSVMKLSCDGPYNKLNLYF